MPDLMPDLATNTWVYWVNPTQDPAEHGGYVPSVVFENIEGHWPLEGDPEKFQAPWIWGATWEQADAIAAEQNEQRGFDRKAAAMVVSSSMWPPLRRTS